MVIAAGLILEFCLILATFLLWRRMAVSSRTVLWRMLLEKYPPRLDTCMGVQEEALESFVIDSLLVGGQSMHLDQCHLVLGERGLHLVNGPELRCVVGDTFKKDYAFIPWSRLKATEDGRSLEVLGTGDRVLIRTHAVARLQQLPDARIGQQLPCA
jgi:hypothetical protein